MVSILSREIGQLKLHWGIGEGVYFGCWAFQSCEREVKKGQPNATTKKQKLWGLPHLQPPFLSPPIFSSVSSRHSIWNKSKFGVNLGFSSMAAASRFHSPPPTSTVTPHLQYCLWHPPTPTVTPHLHCYPRSQLLHLTSTNPDPMTTALLLSLGPSSTTPISILSSYLLLSFPSQYRSPQWWLWCYHPLLNPGGSKPIIVLSFCSTLVASTNPRVVTLFQPWWKEIHHNNHKDGVSPHSYPHRVLLTTPMQPPTCCTPPFLFLSSITNPLNLMIATMMNKPGVVNSRIFASLLFLPISPPFPMCAAL